MTHMIASLLLWQAVVSVPVATQAQKDAAASGKAADALVKTIDGKLYNPDANAASDVDAAMQRAITANKKLLLIMGANWCHDSTSLATRIESGRFQAAMRERYEIVYIDVGVPQTGNGRNLDIAKRYGVKKLSGTPLVLVVSNKGKRLNSKKDAASWRNAASRSDDAVFAYFSEFTPT
jgi:thioredoxin-related protein